MAQLHDSSSFSMRQQQLFPQEEMLEIKKKRKELLIGIPKEDGEFENRVPLTPQAVKLLSDNGHKILFEAGTGNGSNYSDLDYSEAGAEIVSDPKKIFQSEIVLKISPFKNKGIEFLKDNQTVISALHFSSQSKEQINALIKKRVKAIAFEYIKNEPFYYPIVRSMSEIAGKLSINIAAEYLSKQHSGKGVLLGGITGISPAEVIIIGAGTAAEHAANAAMGLGALIKVFDHSIYKLRDLQHNIGKQIFTSIIQPQALSKALKSADVVIGSLGIDEKTERFVVNEYMVQQMKKGTIIIDLNVDNGSCFETSKPTTHKNPVYEKFGVIHYCVPNIASRAARTASIALSNILAPILLKIGEVGGTINLFKTDRGIRNGVYIFNGILTNQTIGTKFGINSKDINLLMAAF
ncbi:MAG: alanine dehydrogenase [Bacteroidetes bacterium]|nr:MAG: alanine dehydrogenase [Bacteroidota bacterium]